MSWQGFFIVIGIVLLICGFIFGIVALANEGCRIACRKTANIMGVEWKYNFWIPCMIKINNRWMTIDNYVDVKGDLE